MKSATTMNAASQPGAHLRLVLDRAGSGTPGIKLSGVRYSGMVSSKP